MHCQIVPIARATTWDALEEALHATPNPIDVLDALCEWLTATPRALECMLVPVPPGAYAMDYTTLDTYMVPRLVAALAVMHAHMLWAEETGARPSAAVLDTAQDTIAATMRLVGTVLHLCLSATRQTSHVRFLLYDTLRSGVRTLVSLGAWPREHERTLAIPPALKDQAPMDAWVLCSMDTVPAPFALAPLTDAPLPARAPNTPPYAWTSSDTATLSLPIRAPQSAWAAQSLLSLCTRIASELASVFPMALQDVVEQAVRVLLVIDDPSSTPSRLLLEALVAAVPVVCQSPTLFHVARMVLAWELWPETDNVAMHALAMVLDHLYDALVARRTPTLPPEAHGLLDDPRAVLDTWIQHALQTTGVERQIHVAQLCIALTLLEQQGPTAQQWDSLLELDDRRITAEAARWAKDAPLSRSASPSLRVSAGPPAKRPRTSLVRAHQGLNGSEAEEPPVTPAPAPTPSDVCALVQGASLSDPLRARETLRTLQVWLAQLSEADLAGWDWDSVHVLLGQTLTHIRRGVRVLAGRVLPSAVARLAALPRDQRPATWAATIERLVRLATEAARSSDHKIQETAVLSIARLGRIHDDVCFVPVMAALVHVLYTPHVFLRALVTTEFVQLAVYRRCTAFQLLSQHLDLVCEAALDAPCAPVPALGELARLVGMHATTFLQTTLSSTLPLLLVQHALGKPEAGTAMEAMAQATSQSVPTMCLSHVSDLFHHIFLQPAAVRDASLQSLLTLLGTRSVTVASLLRSRLHDVLGWLVVHLGSDECRAQALEGLEFVRTTVATSGKWRGMDLTAFLQEEVLAILTWVNDDLSGVHGKLRPGRRAMSVRSIGALVQQIGAVAARVVPQVLASLTSTLQQSDLALPTLESWLCVVQELRGPDLGAIIGPTTAALLAAWPRLDYTERQVAARVLRSAVMERTTDLSFLDDVPSLDAIADDVPDVAQRIRATRRVWDDEACFQHILERVSNDRTAICVQSLHELRAFLHERRACISGWTTGNVFHPLVGRCVRVLMAVATRMELSADVATLCLECLGALGAVDPDRLDMPPDEPIFVLLHDFEQSDESIALAQRLLVDLVVPAFRATHDTKHQAGLAYAIQELLKFCQFTPALLDASAPHIVPDKLRRRWAALPEGILPTLLPLLNSRYVVQSPEPRARSMPLYVHSTSYRDWIQAWVLLLIRAARPGDAAALFSLFESVVRDHDVGIAQALLPHLVLHVLINGSAEQRRMILEELRAVLADQAQPALGYEPERRRMTAQTLFVVLDHIGHWMRRMRLVPPRAVKRSRLRDALVDVQALMDELSPDLLAQASLQCDAYARALLHFEYRIRAAARTQRPEELQPYYETMHEIYASLDDPDGMEGISTCVLEPSLEHQIREHESTGRWTDAQSCWEVELQRRPDDVRLHMGLLRCLRNLGHYDTMRTHIRGVLAMHEAWQPQLAPFQIEGACILADWDAVRRLVQQAHAVPELGMARALLAIREADELAFSLAVHDARQQLGRRLTGPMRVSYAQAYDTVTQLHMLCELELIFQARGNEAALDASLAARFNATLPSFRTREPVLSLRRSALQACRAPATALGACWILSAKTARKASHTQTAYSAILQAMQCGAPYAFVQKAKLLAHTDQVQGALQTLNHALRHQPPTDGDNHALAHAHLLRARLVEDTARFQQNDIVQHYKTCTSLDPLSEKIWYYLGHFYDTPSGGPVGNQMLLQLSVCRFYMKSAQHGTKFLYRTLPRMLTIWLDAGNELAESEARTEEEARQASQQFDKINDMMLKSVRHLARYQWFAVMPQLVARIVHKNEAVWHVLLEIIVAVVAAYPQQGVWALIAGSHSKDKRRKQRYECIVERIASSPERAMREVVPIIEAAERVSMELLHLCDYHVHKEATLSMSKHFPALLAAVQKTPLVLPLQSSMTVLLPPNGQASQTHRPFPPNLPMIQGFDDTIDIMHSLQKPRKIVVHASDGARYPFLCKPRDDLRKDARLMEFDAMINKLLQSSSESRRRRLYIRTYAVIILNEECGLIEWVPNTVAYRQILAKHYAALDKPLYTQDLRTLLDEARAAPKNAAALFDTQILSRYPPVFHAWFLETFPEPSAWFKARSAYARTAAVMSMVGFVLGLGDRHGDNILFDAGSGDTVHVDLNCLFEKGTTFEIPERVPFRLTHNMVDALGVAGVEGAFRRTAEIALGILRDNKESLMSVLQAMVHDPLGEWVATERRARQRHGGDKSASTGGGAGARKALQGVSDKLDGRLRRPGLSDTERHTTKNLVHMLICDATSSYNLSQMYVGWAPYL